MKSIYLDIGNSSLKLAARQNGGWRILSKQPLDDVDKVIHEVESLDRDRNLVISSVREDILTRIQSVLEEDRITVLHRSLIPDEMLNYGTPDTLGLDRFLVCLAAKNITKSGVIVIDSGSACTIDYMNQAGVFEGGIIMPGLGMLKGSISEKLPELPVPPEEIPQIWPGKSTAESIQWGAYWGFAQSIKQFLIKYLRSHPESSIFVTGGDSQFIKKQLTDDFDLQVWEHLLFDGMRDFYEMLNR
ncbi:MAG: type III pantothenate kinase [Balneolaceae bacterium]|nr:type III pantothenate kinase [Balneolaceae bacterium]